MRHAYFAALFALAAASPAFGQSAPQQEDSSDIVVTGTRDMDGQVRDFVGALTKARPGDQLSRFEAAICPTAVGVSPTQKAAIVKRMKRVAGAAGLGIGGADCTPNVLLVVTGEKKSFIEALWKQHNYYFGDMSPGDVRRLAREPGPAAAWQVAGAMIDGDGREITTAKTGDASANRSTRIGSRLNVAARPQFAAAAVVVEMKALEGLTTTQLADYAAMRAFARTDPSKLAGSAPTILKVLETPMGEEVPITITPWDLAFLRSLYAAPANMPASAQRSEIGRRLKEELKQPQAKN